MRRWGRQKQGKKENIRMLVLRLTRSPDEGIPILTYTLVFTGFKGPPIPLHPFHPYMVVYNSPTEVMSDSL